MQEVLTAGYLLTEWKPELINDILQQLTPDRVRVVAIAQRYKDK